MNAAESRLLPGAGQGAFLTTRWSLILRAGDAHEGVSQEALGQLCRDYWYPLYAYARRRGRSPEDAEDTTQGFFLHLLEGGMLQRADASRGRFRSFLLGAMQFHLANEHRSAGTLKRGSGIAPVSLDAMDAEERFRAEPADHITPEAHYDRSWAFALLERVGTRLAEEYVRAGRREMFTALQPCITGRADGVRQEALAVALGMTPVTVRVTIHRMRKRYGDLLREEILHTVETPQEVESEIAHLLKVVASA